jgi:membrane dipeptidase
MVTKLHQDAVAVDCHNDFLILFAAERSSGNRQSLKKRFLPQLRMGGVDVQVAPIYIDESSVPEAALRLSLMLIEQLKEEVEALADEVAICLTGADIDAAVDAGKIAIVLALEGSAPIAGNPDLFRSFFRLGVRMASFTWMRNTPLAGGSGDGDPGAGLTPAGRSSLKIFEELGIVMDVSHLSAASTEEVLSLSTRPLVASHSSARSLSDHHRNLHDEHLKGVAATGGVIGVTAIPMFTGLERATVDGVVDHILHIAENVGIDHVGIGPDFIKEVFQEEFGDKPVIVDGEDWRRTIRGLETPEDLPHITEALERRGMKEEDILKVLGGNFLRVFREVMGRPAA